VDRDGESNLVTRTDEAVIARTHMFGIQQQITETQAHTNMHIC